MRKTVKIGAAVGALALVAAAVSIFAVPDADARDGWKGRHGHHGHYVRHARAHSRGYTMLMERFDADKDGKLTQGELDTSRQDLLAKHDADKDGQLTLAEFEALWLEFMHKQMVRGFQRIDEDGDAVITVDEFVKPYANVLERMDRNDDGVLDGEDRRRRKANRAPDSDQPKQEEKDRG